MTIFGRRPAILCACAAALASTAYSGTLTWATGNCGNGPASATDASVVTLHLDCPHSIGGPSEIFDGNGTASPTALTTSASVRLFYSASGDVYARFDDAYMVPGSGTGSVAYVFASSYTGFQDPGAGTSNLTVTQDGSTLLSSTTRYSGHGNVSVDFGPASDHVDLFQTTASAPIIFGQPFTVSVILHSGVSGSEATMQAATSLSSIRVFDAQGNLLQVQVQAVPEPVSWLLTLAGLGIVGVIRKINRPV